MRRFTRCLMGFIVFALSIALFRAVHAAEPNPGSISSLCSILTDERVSDQEKIKACDDLAAMQYQAWAAVPELVALLPRRGALRIHALKALEVNNPCEVIPELSRRLSSPSPILRAAAADALIAMADQADLIVSQIDHLLNDGKPDERELACSVLEGLGPAASESLPWLLAEIRTRNTATHAPAIAAARAVAPDLDPHLFLFVADLHGNIFDAREAADALGKLGPAGALALPDLLAASETDDRYLHASIAHAIGRLGRPLPESVPGLIDLAVGKLIDEKPPALAIRLKAIQSLTEVRPNSAAAIETFVELLADRQVGDTAAQKLLEMRVDDVKIVEAIGAMLTDAPEIRRRAAIALQGAGVLAAWALGPLKGALADDDAAVRRDAAIAIAGIGAAAAKSAIPELESVVRRGDESSPAAAQALGSMGVAAKSAVPVLIEAFRAEPISRPTWSDWNTSAKIRSGCASALGRIDPNSPATRDLLLEAVRQKDWVVREALTTALVDSQIRDRSFHRCKRSQRITTNWSASMLAVRCAN